MIFVLMIRRTQRSTLFPYTTLFRSIDTKGASWKVFQTKTMPTNFLIEKGGKIKSIAAGCDPSGLLANAVSAKVAELLKTDKVDVQRKVAENK